MAAPITGEPTLTAQPSHPYLTNSDFKTPNSAEGDLIISQLVKFSPTRPQSLSAPVKRRKSKPKRFDVSRTNVKKQDMSPTTNIAVIEPSSPCMRLPKEKSPIPPAMIQAVELRSRLGNEFPSCIKMMVRSQVTCGFWLGLPLSFCKSFLPKEDSAFILEDENGEQWEVKYIAYKIGISAGWKKFAAAHNLIEGDVLVFHLVEPVKFKVYIFRTDNPIVTDTAQICPVTPSPNNKRTKRQETLSSIAVQKKQKKSTPPRSIAKEHSGNDSEEVGSEVLEGSRSTKTNKLPFQEIKSFEDFHILVKGVCIDGELPEDVRSKYYMLCAAKSRFLHDDLREGLYDKLVVGMIGETVSIANEIKNCKLTTTREELDVWDNSLKSFELLGMEVGFLREKIRKLVKLVFESEAALEIKRYADARNEQKRVDDEIKSVLAKLSEMKKSAKKLEGITGSLRKKVEKYEKKLSYEVNSPW